MKLTDRPFDPGALQLLAAARAESARLGHEYLGTEHVVLALSEEGTLLGRLGVDATAVRATLQGVVSAGAARVPAEATLPYTSRTKVSLEYADAAARTQGRKEVAAEHVLLGLMREGKSIGAQVLQSHGLTAEAVEAYARTQEG